MKLFISEKGSAEMLRFALSEDDRGKVISALAQIEARSAICRLRSERSITPGEATVALSSLSGEIARYFEQPVNRRVLEMAATLVDRHSLRALDAVQLGSAIVARDLLASPAMRFIASDRLLLAAAEVEGFLTWNPST